MDVFGLFRGDPPDMLRRIFKFGGTLNLILKPSLNLEVQARIVKLIMKENWYFRPELNFKFDPKTYIFSNISGSISLKFNIDLSKYDVRHFYIIMSVLELENKGLIKRSESRVFIAYICEQLNLDLIDLRRWKFSRWTRFVNGKEVERIELLVEEREVSKSISRRRQLGLFSFVNRRNSQTDSIDSS